MQLDKRQYQDQFVEEKEHLARDGKLDIVCIAIMGSGKTIMAGKAIAQTCQKLRKGKKILFIADGIQLVKQAGEKFESLGLHCGYIGGKLKEDRNAPVQIATIQALQKRSSIDWLDVASLYIDEAHTTSWYGECRKFRDRFPDIPFFHLTATPYRLAPDEEMGDIALDFARMGVVYGPSPLSLMEMGFLVWPTYYGLPSSYEIKLDSPEGIQLAATEYERIAAGKPGIIFAKNIPHAKAIAAAVSALGYKAIAVDGKLPTRKREIYYAGLADGTINVLVSADLLIKGFDCPPTWYCGLWRDTQSKVIAFQQMGRVLRTHPGKFGCAIADAAGLTAMDRFGRIEDISISRLVRSSDRTTLIRTKTCPKCRIIHSVFVAKCKCGHVFYAGKNETKEFNTVERLCLKMSEEDIKKMIVYRQWLQDAYLSSEEPEVARTKYVDTFGTEPPNEWRKGAVFGDRPSESDKVTYWEYLGNRELPVKEKFMNWEFGTLNDYIFLSEPTNAPRKSSKRKKQAKSDPETDSDLISSVLNSLMP